MNDTAFDDDDKDFEMDGDEDDGWDDMEEEDEYIPIETNKRPTKDLIFARVTGVYREEPLHINREFKMNITITNINDKTMDDLSKIICRNVIDYTLMTKTQNLFVREWIKGISVNGMKSNIYHDNKVKKIKLVNALQMFDDSNVNINVSIASYGAKSEYCINVDHLHLHKFNQKNCPNIKSSKNDYDTKQNDKDIICSCNIYSNMLQNNKYAININNYNHMNQYYHGEKKTCKFGTRCDAFMRLENGGNELIDKCHLILFDHPPRNKQIKLPDKFNPFVYDENYQHPAKLYVPNNNEYQFAVTQKGQGYLRFLLIEVIQNGFVKDLMCRQPVKFNATELIKLIMNETDSGNYNKYIPLLNVVDEKLNHPRHISMGCPLRRDEMLCLIMYTGCDSNYDLCKTQREGDYKKWEIFDKCLYEAIAALNDNETGSYKIYTGLNNVQLPVKSVDQCYFPTYVSTSWIKDISLTFVGDKGMIIEIDKLSRKRLQCCDVSWISKFSDECEVLIARTIPHSKNNNRKIMGTYIGGIETTWYSNPFKLSVVDEHDGVQLVSLSGGIATKNSRGLDGCVVQ
eukprot:276659_1